MPYDFDETVGRRRFLRTLGVAGAAAGAGALAGCTSRIGAYQHDIAASGEGAAAWGREAGEWIPSCCNMCGGQSGILCHVVNGVVEKIEPNHWNPNNYSNISTDFFDGYTEEYGCAEGGALCPKGNAGIMQLYDPDRVQRPLKRTNPRKGRDEDPGWQEISWAQAVDEIAAKLRALREGGEAHKLLWWSEDHSFTHIQDDFCQLFGSPNYSNHSNLCDVSRKASFKMAMGDDRPLSDFLQSKYILLFGWNPTSAIKWVHLPRTLTRGIERGARLVVVDPYLSDTAAKAHEWVQILPGTDGALALALAHVIIREQLYDHDFIANWTVGFAEFSEYVKDKTPQWAEKITSVPAAAIERIARELATTKPACVDVWSGPGQHSNGVQGGRAIALLAALVGGYDQPGTLLLPDKRGNKHAEVEPDATAERTLDEPRYDGVKDFPIGHKSGVYGRCWERLLAGNGPYQPKVGVCVFQNLVMSGPGSSQVEAALKKLETLVVVDTMVSETALLADYLIPGTVYLERYDLNSHWVTWPVLGLRQPVVKAATRQTSPFPYQGGIFGQMAEYEFVTALGRKLGLRTADGTDFFRLGPASRQPIEDLTAWYEDYLSNELQTGAPKMTLAQLKQLPGAVWVDRSGTKYRKYAALIPAAKLAKAFVDGDITVDGTAIYDKPKDQHGKRIGTVIGGRPIRGFFTASGKVEFYSPSLIGKNDAHGRPVDPLPVYRPRDWQPDAEFPLYLINWKEASHTHTRSQNNAWLREIKPSNPLVIHPDTASRLGIENGDEVWVESRHGKTRAVAKVTRRIHPAVVGAQHGFGHWRLGRGAAGVGTAFGDLNTVAYDALSGQGLHKEICVKVYKA
ncbi:MAG: molybdopterin-dependent oxidoreductase [Armatimonadetes bacterium]|nr:molybdopterin-dependent oxidoreductase [Armatimonadota bacterium]